MAKRQKVQVTNACHRAQQMWLNLPLLYRYITVLRFTGINSIVTVTALFTSFSSLLHRRPHTPVLHLYVAATAASSARGAG